MSRRADSPDEGKSERIVFPSAVARATYVYNDADWEALDGLRQVPRPADVQWPGVVRYSIDSLAAPENDHTP